MDKSPDRVRLITLTPAPGCHRRCVKRGNLIWLGSSVTETLVLRFTLKVFQYLYVTLYLINYEIDLCAEVNSIDP